MKIIRIFFFMGTVTFVACSFFFEQREYFIELPPLPENYSFVQFWTVEIRTGRGEGEILSLSAAASSFTVRAGKEERLFVLAHGSGPGSFSVKPAGLYLDGYSRSAGQLSFDAGPPVKVLIDAQDSGVDLRSFNCSRLLEEWDEEGLISPWFMDSSVAAEAIGAGCFSLLKLKEAPLLPVKATGGSDWIGEDPFIAPGIPAFLPPGNYCFYNGESSLLRKIALDEEGNEISLDSMVNDL